MKPANAKVGRVDAAVAELEAALAALEPPDVPAALATLEAVRLRSVAGFVRSLQAPKEDPLLTMSEAAKRLRTKESHVRELGRRGEFPIVMVGRYVRVRASSVDAWIKQNDFGLGLRGRR